MKESGTAALLIPKNFVLSRAVARRVLWKTVTQTVFGEGASNAKVVFIGQQPGNEEDMAGKSLCDRRENF